MTRVPLLAALLLGAQARAEGDGSRWDGALVMRACDAATRSLPAELETVLDAVVTISTPHGHGAGFLASPDGFVFTAAHVVDGGDALTVRGYSGIELPGTVVRVDSEYDVAVLRIPGAGHPCLALADGAIPIGTELFAIGSPADPALSHSVSRGIVSGRREHEGHRFLQTDASLNPGNSGGPLVGPTGEALAVVSWKVTATGYEGLSFGIPVDSLTSLLGIESGPATDLSAAGAATRPRGALAPPPRPGARTTTWTEGTAFVPPVRKQSLTNPLLTTALGLAMAGGSWALVQGDEPITEATWHMAQATNAVGWLTAAGGTWWTIRVAANNRRAASAGDEP